MEIDTKFKKLMISHPEIVRKAVLTDKQIEQFELAQTIGVIRNLDIAAAYGLSAQSSSGVLSKLYKAGYLSRTRENSPTGGFQYAYQPTFQISYRSGGDE